MSGQTTLLRLAVFQLSLALGSACFGVEPIKFFDLTKTLNERMNERIEASLKNPELKPRFLDGGCGGSHGLFFCGGSHALRPLRLLESPHRSKHGLPDDPISTLTTAFQDCTNLSILIVDTSSPVSGQQSESLKNELHDGFLILEKTETSDTFALRLIYRFLFEALQPNEFFEFCAGRSADEEINEYKYDCRFAPNIVFVFEGKNSLQVELDTEHRCAVLRTKDKWGGYAFDQLSADAIEARANDLHALYATP